MWFGELPDYTTLKSMMVAQTGFDLSDSLANLLVHVMNPATVL